MTHRPRRWVVAILGVVASVLGGFAALALLVAFTVLDDPCPSFEDEGPMAAPGSPYARIMCEPAVTAAVTPMTQIPVPAVLLLSAGIALAATPLLVWRRPRIAARRYLAAGLVGVLLVPPLLVVVLQHTLPRDCLSGPTATGECSRDREQR